jgi:glyoxylase-like metal-dependent hydrolase (beta-lactamase superfamily II)
MQHWRVGDVEITCVTETVFEVPGAFLVRDFDPVALGSDADVLRPHHLTDGDLLRIAIQSFLVRSAGRTIIVDTCFGNDHELPYPNLVGLRTDHLAELAAAGFDRDAVDVVVCTHLHLDHVGWNTMLEDGEWVPTFPNADYLFAAAEYAHWREAEAMDTALRESVDPVVAAGLHRFVPTDHPITAEVHLVPTPGHTPGHVSVRIASAGQQAWITGDMVHHPVQVLRSDWASMPDHDPVRSVATRGEIFPRLADEAVLVLGTHFAEPTGGHVQRDSSGWTWSPHRC